MSTNLHKFEIPAGTEPARCRGCREVIYWIKTRNNKNMPVNRDGTSHFSTCKDAQRFRQPREGVFWDKQRDNQKLMVKRLMEVSYRLADKDLEFIENVNSSFQLNSSYNLSKGQQSWLLRLYEEHA